MEVSFGASDPGGAIGAAVYTAGLRNRSADAATTPCLAPRTTSGTSSTYRGSSRSEWSGRRSPFVVTKKGG